MASNPLSQIISKSGLRYGFRNGTMIGHMDDIDLYAKTERDIDSLIYITRIYTTEMNMSFRLDKCVRKLSKRGKMITI